MRKALLIEKKYWKQKARVKWANVGDKSTKHFHSVVKQRRVKSFIHRIQEEGGNWLTEEEEIAAKAVSYFSTLFTKVHGQVNYNLGDIIPKFVTN